MDKENKLILYKDEEGRVSVNTRFADEDVWLTRENLAEMYATTPQNISLHVGNIYQDKELSEEGNSKEILTSSSRGQKTSASKPVKWLKNLNDDSDGDDSSRTGDSWIYQEIE